MLSALFKNYFNKNLFDAHPPKSLQSNKTPHTASWSALVYPEQWKPCQSSLQLYPACLKRQACSAGVYPCDTPDLMYVCVYVGILLDAYDRSLSPLGLSAWICVFLTSLSPWVRANFVVAFMGHLNFKCHFFSGDLREPESSFDLRRNAASISVMMSQSRQDKMWL